MIKIYYAYTDILPTNRMDQLETKIPERERLKLDRFRRKEDKLLHLTAILLLSKALRENGFDRYRLQDLCFTNEGRPFFQNESFDFNISHSGNMAALAFSNKGRVGIDLETIVDVDFVDFETVFSREVWDKIHASDSPIRQFFFFWTQLESAVKADGRGLPVLSTAHTKILKDLVLIDGKEWSSHPINLDPSISCCVSSESKDDAIERIEIKTI